MIYKYTWTTPLLLILDPGLAGFNFEAPYFSVSEPPALYYIYIWYYTIIGIWKFQTLAFLENLWFRFRCFDHMLIVQQWQKMIILVIPFGIHEKIWFWLIQPMSPTWEHTMVETKIKQKLTPNHLLKFLKLFSEGSLDISQRIHSNRTLHNVQPLHECIGAKILGQF